VTKTLLIAEADARTRTGDPFITSEVLYQLSYVGSARRIAALRRRNSLVAGLDRDAASANPCRALHGSTLGDLEAGFLGWKPATNLTFL
jgi:hypothetical protein